MLLQGLRLAREAGFTAEELANATDDEFRSFCGLVFGLEGGIASTLLQGLGLAREAGFTAEDLANVPDDEFRSFCGLVFGLTHGSKGGIASSLLQGLGLAREAGFTSEDLANVPDDEFRSFCGRVFGLTHGSKGGNASTLILGIRLAREAGISPEELASVSDEDFRKFQGQALGFDNAFNQRAAVERSRKGLPLQPGDVEIIETYKRIMIAAQSLKNRQARPLCERSEVIAAEVSRLDPTNQFLTDRSFQTELNRRVTEQFWRKTRNDKNKLIQEAIPEKKEQYPFLYTDGETRSDFANRVNSFLNSKVGAHKTKVAFDDYQKNAAPGSAPPLSKKTQRNLQSLANRSGLQFGAGAVGDTGAGAGAGAGAGGAKSRDLAGAGAGAGSSRSKRSRSGGVGGDTAMEAESEQGSLTNESRWEVETESESDI